MTERQSEPEIRPNLVEQRFFYRSQGRTGKEGWSFSGRINRALCRTIPIIPRSDTRSNRPPFRLRRFVRDTGLLLYARPFKLDIFESDSIKISAAVLPRDKCCTKITVAADLVPKVQYISRAPANTPKRCTYYPDTIPPTASLCLAWTLYESNCFSTCPGPPESSRCTNGNSQPPTGHCLPRGGTSFFPKKPMQIFSFFYFDRSSVF